MTTAVEPTLSVEINQINEELFADTAVEASGMPASIRTEASAINRDITCHHHLAALQNVEEEKSTLVKFFNEIVADNRRRSFRRPEDF